MTMLSDGMLMAAGGSTAKVFVSAVDGEQASGTASITFTKPAGVQGGDLLVAIVWGDASLTAVSLAGWTAQSSVFSGSLRYSILTRTVDGSEGSSFVFAATNTATKFGSILAYRNVTAIQVGTLTTSATTTATAASLTATDAGLLVTSFANLTGGVTVSTPPTSSTQRTFRNTPGGSADYELNTASPVGATPAKTLVWSANVATAAGVAIQVY